MQAYDLELIHSTVEAIAMRTRRILVVIISLVWVFPSEAPKCKAAPKSVQNVHLCCTAPMPNWGVFNSDCHSAGSQASCRLACIFNVSSALQGTRLVQGRIRPMLERAFTNEATIDVYESNFARCSSIVKSKYQELAPMSRQSDACDRHALFYSLCAYARLMFTCPEKMWQRNNKMCQEAKTYGRNCFWPALKMFMKNT